MIILYTGHNEFYGYKGYSEIAGKSNYFIEDVIENILKSISLSSPIEYDNNLDDFETLLPVNSNNKIITNSQYAYIKIKNNFISNINQISYKCVENQVQLILTTMPDNYLLPPLGISNNKEEVSTDILFSNARMALIRDGNISTAVKLFKKTKDSDGLRLRVPEDFNEDMKNISFGNTADVYSEFANNSPNGIPGNELFLDYIHPSKDGLDLIASVYARVIINNYCSKNNIKNEFEPVNFSESISIEDSVLAKKRVDRSLELIKKLKSTQYENAAGMY